MSLDNYYPDPRQELEGYLRSMYTHYRLLELGGQRVIRGVLSPRFAGMRDSLSRVLDSFPGNYRFEKAGDEIYLTISTLAARGEKSKWKLHALLFLATVLTTLLVGALREGGNPLLFPSEFWLGIPFSATVMLILLVHELGHYFAARQYGMDVSLPYFIPLPPPFIFGTAGALIKMRSPLFNRRMLLDIGAAGPIAGFLVSVPAVVLGMMSSSWVETQPQFYIMGHSLLFSALAHLVLGAPPPGTYLELSSVAFAGWIGLFVTALNLIPIGQLDGGHIAYALFGQKHSRMAYAFFAMLLIMGLKWPGWIFWAFLVLIFIRIKHPPLVDEQMPLDRKRLLAGAATILIFLLTFVPVPITA